jgi:hypothetical protein
MSISKWSSNHQKVDVLSLLTVFVAYIVDRLRRIAACKSWKIFCCAFDVKGGCARCCGSQEVHDVVVAIH